MRKLFIALSIIFFWSASVYADELSPYYQLKSCQMNTGDSQEVENLLGESFQLIQIDTAKWELKNSNLRPVLNLSSENKISIEKEDVFLEVNFIKELEEGIQIEILETSKHLNPNFSISDAYTNEIQIQRIDDSSLKVSLLKKTPDWEMYNSCEYLLIKPQS